MADVTAGWASDEAERKMGEGHPCVGGDLLERRDQVELGRHRGPLGVEPFGLAGRPTGLLDLLARLVAAGEEAAVERTPRDDAHAVALAGGEHGRLDAAHEDRIRRLLAPEALVTSPFGHPLGLDDLVGREGRTAGVADLALVHQVGQRRQGVVDVGGRVGTVHLVEVDVVGAETAQRVLDLGHDPAPRVAPLVGVLAHGAVELGGQHHVVAAALQGLADDLLGLARPSTRRRCRRS